MATSAQAGIAPAGVANASGVVNPTTSAVAAPAGSAASIDSLLSGLFGGAANIYGSQNAAEAQNNGILAGIGQQNTTMGNINSLFGAQTSAGNNAFTQLQKLQGGSSTPADYSNFSNSPGYQFAVDQGTQAINRQAAASGSLYTPNTLNSVGQYVTGTASQNYNNYVQQLLSTAGYGAQGNAALGQANLTTGSNISQLDQNSGNAEAGGVAGAAGGVSGLVGSLLGNSTVQKGVGSLLGSLFGDSTGAAGIGAGADALATSTIGNLGLDASTAASEAGVASNVAASNAATDFSGLGNISGIGADSGAGGATTGAAGAASDASGLAGAGASAAGAGASGAVGSAGANALAASGSFATGGGAGATSAGAGAAGSAGSTLAAAAGPAAIAAAGFLASQALGAAWTAKNTQGNAAMKGWMQATGAKWVPNPASAYNNGNTFQTTNAQNAAASNPGTMYDAHGNVMTPAQASAAIAQWAKANGVNPGDFK